MKKFFSFIYMFGKITIFSLIIFCAFIFYILQYKNDFVESKIITIEKGETVDKISDKLIEQHIAPQNKIPVKYILKLTNRYKQMQYGEYEIAPHETLLQVVKNIVNGKVYHRQIKIPSGFTNKDLFKIINKNNKLIGDFDQSGVMEGMLFPDTYNYRIGDSKQKLINKMQDTMIQVLKKEWAKKDSNLPYHSIYDVLIIASIIEKEAITYDDKRKVASVFLNRIKNGQKLQSDPTTQYGVDLFYGKKVNLNKNHFLQPYPHSTYYVFGLPITAICNPSLSSIKAALHPDKTNYLYFISMPNDTRLFFSKTYKEHLNYVAKLYQARREAKWRDNHAFEVVE